MPEKTNAAPETASIFEQLGGAPAITAAVDRFYQRVLSDPLLVPFFEKIDLSWLKKKQAAFFTQALGGPSIYKGREMKQAHAKVAIEQIHFDRVAGHLAATLEELKAPAPVIAQVLGAIAALAGEIVNTPSMSMADTQPLN